METIKLRDAAELLDLRKFSEYVAGKLGYRWRSAGGIGSNDLNCQCFDALGNKLKSNDDLDKTELIVLLAGHSDRDYDAIIDAYQVHVWLRGKGAASTEIFQTGLLQPAKEGISYHCGLRMDSCVTVWGLDFIHVCTTVENKRQNWLERRDIKIEWLL